MDTLNQLGSTQAEADELFEQVITELEDAVVLRYMNSIIWQTTTMTNAQLRDRAIQEAKNEVQVYRDAWARIKKVNKDNG